MMERDDDDWFERELVKQLGLKKVELSDILPIIKAFDDYVDATKQENFEEIARKSK